MAPPANKHSTFRLFPSLPPELRIQIWHEALPTIGPALYFYRKSVWHRIRGNEGQDDEDEDLDPWLEIRTDLLDDAQFEIPLVFVNREARSIALTWIRKQGIQTRRLTGRRDPIFVRGFDPACDALLVSFEKVDDFYREPEGSNVDIGSHLTRLAMSEELLRSELFTLPVLFGYLSAVRVFLIVVDAPPNLRHADNEMRVQRRWEFKSTPGGTFVWNGNKHRFDHQDGEYNDDDPVYRLIEEATSILSRVLVRNQPPSFEVRPVAAVRQ